MAGGEAQLVDVDLLQRARDSLPGQLNAGILMGDGGFCVLGWMLYCAGFHEISLYANTVAVADPARGGPATDVVAAVFGLPVDDVVELARVNDESPAVERHAAVVRQLDDLLTAARAEA